MDAPTPPWTGPTLEHLQAIHDELKSSLDAQLTELSALDTRAAVLLTPGGILLGLGVNAAAKIGPSHFALWVFNIGLLVLLLSRCSSWAQRSWRSATA